VSAVIQHELAELSGVLGELPCKQGPCKPCIHDRRHSCSDPSSISLSFSGTILSCAESAAFIRLSRLEGIIPALETSHAIAILEKLCPDLPEGFKVVLNCSGRGDKDVNTAIKLLGDRV